MDDSNNSGFSIHKWMVYNGKQLGGNSNIFFISTPKFGARWSHFDDHIFQMGWFNHQLEEELGFLAMFFFWRLVWGILIRSHGMYINHHENNHHLENFVFFPSTEQARLRRWEGDHRVTHQVIDWVGQKLFWKALTKSLRPWKHTKTNT